MIKIEHLVEEIKEPKTRKISKVIKLENGKNLKAKLIKRNYLNKSEHNQLFTILGLVRLIEGENGYGAPSNVTMWDEWAGKGMMTKDQVKNLKLANTYLSKFASSVINDNLDVQEKTTIINKSKKFEYRLIDDYTLHKVREMLNSTKGIFVPKDLFDEMICDTMDIKCNGCKADRSNCEFRGFLENNFIPPFYEIGKVDKQECSCEYSYNL